MLNVKSFCLAIVAIAMCSQSIHAQSSLTYGRSGSNNEGYEVIPTHDGGFMVGGHCTDASGSFQYWVVKVDNQGNVAWDSLYELGYSRSFLWSIQPSDDGGALLAGYTAAQGSGLESALMVKIDSVGRVVKSYDVNYAKADHAHWFAHRKQGGYFWGGHTDSEGDPTGDMILQKLDTGMNKIWDKTYALTPNSGEHGHCGTLTSDGGCVLAGHTTKNGQEHTWAVRVDSNGKTMWMKLFDSSATLSESPYGIVTTREGGFAIFGGTSTSSASNMRLLVLDSAGNKLIDKLYGTGSSWAYDGIQCSDGGYALAGYVATQTTEKAQFVRTDAKGKQKWIKQYNGDGLAWGYALFQHNNQLVLIGGTKLPSTSTSDMWVLYADSNGVIASYDTIRPGLLFTFNSAQVTWVAGEIDTVHGWVQNLSTDSAHFNFTRQIKSKLPGTFFSNIYFGIAGSSGDMNSSPIGIGPLETLPIIDLLANYDAANGDTAMICYTLQPIGEGATGPSERCITEYPQVVGFVDVSEQNGPLSLSIFPNPLSSSALHTTIVSNTPIQRVEVFDCLGNKVRTLISAASASLQWDVKDGSGNPLPAGVYYLRAITASGSVGANVIVQ